MKLKSKFTQGNSRLDAEPAADARGETSPAGQSREELPKDSLTRFARTVWEMAVINGRGWLAVISRQALEVVKIFREIPLLTLFFIGFSFLTCMSVILPWMTYKVILLGTEPETVGIGSASKLFFFLPGAYGLFIVVFGFPRRALIYYGLVILAALAYGLGIFYPDWIHTSMLKRSDFIFTIWMTVYGIALGGAALLALRGALNKAIFEIQELMARIHEEPGETI